MDIEKLNKQLNKAYGGSVHCEFLSGSNTPGMDNRSVVVSGKLSSWQDIVDACTMCVDEDNLTNLRHVVNHIELDGVTMPEMRIPEIEDKALDGDKPDILIIGGGISGASIARELTKWKLDVLLVEKESDLAMQSSGRNDGEIHPGVDQGGKNLKHKYVIIGNRMYEKLCADLDVPFKWLGQYVGVKGKALKPLSYIFAAQKRKIGIDDTKVISRKELYKAQPNMNPGFDFAIFNSRSGSVCPYGLTIALGENAVQNGARVSLNTAVLSMEIQDHIIKSVKTNRGTIYPKIVINAAGTFSDKVAVMADDEFFSIHPRRGTNSILDHKAKTLTPSIVSFKNLKGNQKYTKGGGIVHTVDDNILVGPDAIETYERENYETNRDSIENVFNKQRIAVGTLNEKDIITYFTGIRAPSFEEDFIIEKGRKTKNLIHCAAIQSPGITAAPAIALDIEKMAVEMLGSMGEKLEKNEDFNPKRHGIPRLREMSDEERAKLINSNPDYGIMICRCEEISKGEILDALKSPIFVPTVDGIKKRVRPGMGRCQGGFCSPLVTKIIAEYMEENISDVTKSGNDSKISYGKLK